jgi:hypothetical protein
VFSTGPGAIELIITLYLPSSNDKFLVKVSIPDLAILFSSVIGIPFFYVSPDIFTILPPLAFI